MWRFLGILVTIVIAAAQPLPSLGFGSVNSGYAWEGPKIVYPGFSNYYGFATTNWRVPVTCSASGNTCSTAGSGFTPTGNETFVSVTATTPPTGLETMAGGYQAFYKICNVSGTQFQLGQSNSCSIIETFSSTGTAVSIIFVPASIPTHGYIVSNTGWPSGTTLKWGVSNSGVGWNFDASVTANGNVQNIQNTFSMVLKATIPTNAAPGNYTIAINTCNQDNAAGACSGAGALSDTLSFTITVTALTYLSDANEATSFPAITGLSTWSNFMTNATVGGAAWCAKSTGAMSPADQTSSIGLGGDAQYYDGGLNYWRIANYLGDSQWQNCTRSIQQQMGWGNAASAGGGSPHGYIIGNNGQIQGFQAFPVGFKTAIPQDPRYIGVVQYMAGTMVPSLGGGAGLAFLTQGCRIGTFSLRENSYALDTFLTIDSMGLAPVDPPGLGTLEQAWKAREHRCADEIISALQSQVDGTMRFQENQYFMDGLAMDAIIHWWQATKDPRVPIVVKATLDDYYSNYNISGHKAMWDPQPAGIHCIAAPTWITADTNGHCHDNTSTNVTDLHNLVSHAFAWYWRVSGDDTYRTEGDEVFSHALDDIADWVHGKTFSQFFRYSFNYVGWRQGWLSPEKSIQ